MESGPGGRVNVMGLGGVLPFSDEAAITDRAGLVLDRPRVRIWPTGNATQDVGQAYDYGGVAEASAADALVEHRNREVRTEDGRRYRVVSATWNPVIGYVSLALRRVSGDG